LLNGNEFKQALFVLDEEASAISPDIKLLNKSDLLKASEEPLKSNIDDYENIMNP
jgi:hypothetical protein